MMRISEETYYQLQHLSKEYGKSKQDIMAQAIKKLKNELFLKRANQEYAQLKKQDPAAWKEMEEEAKLWDVTLTDGLDPYE